MHDRLGGSRLRWIRTALAWQLTGLVAWIAAGSASAGDWPQLLGPDRNGVARDERLAASWPESGPAEQWRASIGTGYAGVAVSGKAVVVFDLSEEFERLTAFEATTGRQLWRTTFPASYEGGVNPDRGPRCVPLIHGGRVYAYGAAGELRCVRLEDGGRVFSQPLAQEHRALLGYFGAGSTPVVAGGKLLLNVGGRAEAGLVAVSLDNGQTVWKHGEEGASYSSPIVMRRDGAEQAVFITRMHALAVDPASGKTLWSFPFGKQGPTVNAASPVAVGDRLFLSASYGVGATLLDVSGAEPRPVWSDDDVMSSQYTTCVARGNLLWGVHGREDVGRCALRCIDATDGRVVWSEENYVVAHLILAGDKILSQRVDGQVELLRATDAGYHRLAAAQVLDETCRALPALADGRLFVRGTGDSGGTLVCLKVGE